MRLSKMIPVSVVIITKNEEKRLPACLEALKGFDDVWIVDSLSGDRTPQIAMQYNVRFESFIWNKRYPKKRQWCLETLEFKYDWVLFIDADEHMHEALIAEIKALQLESEKKYAGFFVRGKYIWKGQVLEYGLKNNKIALLHKKRMMFPEVNDLNVSGMGEIEGHYQPVFIDEDRGYCIGQLESALFHVAEHGWNARHMRYAIWEAGMNKNKAWPKDPNFVREMCKKLFRAMPGRNFIAFIHCYILKLGFLDGAAGYDFAKSRGDYYRMISDANKDLANINEAAK